MDDGGSEVEGTEEFRVDERGVKLSEFARRTTMPSFEVLREWRKIHQDLTISIRCFLEPHPGAMGNQKNRK
jgi:hypothetical protein